MKYPAALLIAIVAVAQAGPRTSANYSLIPESADAGGQHATNVSYQSKG